MTARDLPNFARFWMICRKPDRAGAKTEPRARYSTRADAEADAARLARDTGAPFLVLETVAVVRPADTAQESLL